MALLKTLLRGPIIIVARNASITEATNCARGPIIVARNNSTSTTVGSSICSRGPIIVAKGNSISQSRGPIIIVARNTSNCAGTSNGALFRGPIIVARSNSNSTICQTRGPIIVARNNSNLSGTGDAALFKGPIIVARGPIIVARTSLATRNETRGPLIIVARHNSTKPDIDSIIRVDHAGELGADRIYAGQMAVLGQTSKGALIQHMWDQEKRHRAKFEDLIRMNRVRPTVMTPIWNVLGFALGAGSALLGEKAAMACTVAVETVIVDHYNDQLRELADNPVDNKDLMDAIKQFRDEEQEHHDTGIDHGAEQAPFYKLLSETIKFGCKGAIAISKVI